MLADEERAIDEDDWLRPLTPEELRAGFAAAAGVYDLPRSYPGLLVADRRYRAEDYEDPRVQNLRDACDAL